MYPADGCQRMVWWDGNEQVLYGDYNGLYGDHNGLYGDYNGLYGDYNGLYRDYNGSVILWKLPMTQWASTAWVCVVLV